MVNETSELTTSTPTSTPTVENTASSPVVPTEPVPETVVSSPMITEETVALADATPLTENLSKELPTTQEKVSTVVHTNAPKTETPNTPSKASFDINPKRKNPIALVIGLVLFLTMTSVGAYFVSQRSNLADNRSSAKEAGCAVEGCDPGYTCNKTSGSCNKVINPTAKPATPRPANTNTPRPPNTPTPGGSCAGYRCTCNGQTTCQSTASLGGKTCSEWCGVQNGNTPTPAPSVCAGYRCSCLGNKCMTDAELAPYGGCNGYCQAHSTPTPKLNATPTANSCGGRAYLCRWEAPAVFATVSNAAANYISCSGDKPNYGSVSGDDGRCGRPVTQGGSCSGLVRSSNGEANHGGFVGCQGKKNCFCGGANNSVGVGGSYSGGNIECFDDYANDSCGKDTSVVGGNPTATPRDNPNDTPTPTTPNTPICTNIKVYKGTTQVTPSTLLPGDTVTIAVVGTGNPTQARFRVNGEQITGDTDADPNWTTTTTKNASSEYFVSYTIPTDVVTFLFEAETFAAGAWH